MGDQWPPECQLGPYLEESLVELVPDWGLDRVLADPWDLDGEWDLGEE